ncbi:hypothetical protein AXF42_Ash017430 [Apostasia shenzhenica]|uniref:Uncharacterized protein n=1 Tax=Apostasia shenzhenica TaxID=1088818 RepID=A0A2H9ZZ02_9ASPA|nr:hypothetical protein AXF42_Ash017430 [Apostasia shenzhenica]
MQKKQASGRSFRSMEQMECASDRRGSSAGVAQFSGAAATSREIAWNTAASIFCGEAAAAKAERGAAVVKVHVERWRCCFLGAARAAIGGTEERRRQVAGSLRSRVAASEVAGWRGHCDRPWKAECLRKCYVRARKLQRRVC